MRGVNLIPQERRRAGARAVRVRLWAAAVIIYGGALAGVYVWMTLHAAAPQDWDEPAAHQQRAIEAIQQETNRQRVQLAREEAALRASESIAGQPDWSMLLALLARASGQSSWIESATLKPAPGDPSARDKQALMTLSIEGLSVTQEAVSSFALALERYGLFKLVRILEARRRQNNGSEVIAFRVECLLEVDP